MAETHNLMSKGTGDIAVDQTMKSFESLILRSFSTIPKEIGSYGKEEGLMREWHHEISF